MLYAAIEPFGGIGHDERAGMTVSAIVKQWGGNESAKPADFFPSLREPEPDPEDEEAVEAFLARRQKRLALKAQLHAAVNRDRLK